MVGWYSYNILDSKIDNSLLERKTKQCQTSIAHLQTQLATFELSDSSRLKTVSHLLEIAKKYSYYLHIVRLSRKSRILRNILSNAKLSGKRLQLKIKRTIHNDGSL